MYFTQQETDRRFKLLDLEMAQLDLDAVVLITLGPGPTAREEFYFLQSDYIQSGVSLTILGRNQQPVVLSYYLQSIAHGNNSSVRDSRALRETENPGAALLAVLREKGITGRARVGWRWAKVPASWYVLLQQELPEVEWVDMASTFTKMWYQRSTEEAEASARSAQLADAGYDHILTMIEPGVTEVDVVSEFENFTFRQGANRNFTVVASGKIRQGSAFPELAAPSRRVLERGDSIVLEMTPAFAGYYSQLVRVVNVGVENPWAQELKTVATDAIEAATRVLRPGVPIGDVGQALMASVTEAGFKPQLPVGHTVGVDLVYDRLAPDATRVLHENDAIIIHPNIHSPEGHHAFFWGETYLVTGSGNRKLNRANTELCTVGAAANGPVSPVAMR